MKQWTKSSLWKQFPTWRISTASRKTIFFHLSQSTEVTWAFTVLKDSRQIAVYHVLSAIRSRNPCNRLQSYLYFSYQELRNDFTKFTANDVKLSKAFQLVDTSKPSRDGSDSRNRYNKRGVDLNEFSDLSSFPSKSPNKSTKEISVCAYALHEIMVCVIFRRTATPTPIMKR